MCIMTDIFSIPRQYIKVNKIPVKTEESGVTFYTYSSGIEIPHNGSDSSVLEDRIYNRVVRV